MNKNIPNIITISRIILIPIFLYFIVSAYIVYPADLFQTIIGLIIFIILAITDKFDGFLARKYNIISPLGKILDPVADKCLMLSALLVLVAFNRLNFIIVIILILREVLITIYRLFYIRQSNIIIAADNWGKIKTVLFFIICPITFLPVIPQVVNNILFIPVVLVSLYSFIVYLTKSKVPNVK
ncbi:MAG: CDP-diacylglycerol--glycerol-3-phosphate 3-phosphatidyltransferase [Bifidobacteriaceae bacterium]|jgi:CDP-diacylglycerol--glycerol-3-phosphate 3-phosphatidyltransferase|nr:CDP-diacylglycerol--glycerol-3-phosphate 3-phosphatidyltransferase [Bifidobacteriaceae bacterium]